MSSRTEQQRMWLKDLNSSQSHKHRRCRGSACHLARVIFVKGAPHAKRKPNTKGAHYSGLLIIFTCLFLFVVVISWRSEVYIVKICNKIRGHDKSISTFMLPILGPKPHILPDHKVRTKTPQSQPVQEKSVPFVFVTVLTTWHKKGRVRNSVWDFNAAAVAVCECGFVRAALQR